jgi:hypothetical protein
MSVRYQNEIERHNVNGCVVAIMADTDPQNPRTEWDNACTMVCWHNRHALGDKHDFPSPQDFMEWWDAIHKDTGTLKPLYLYDHSSLRISTTPFSCPWDSGPVGWAYITKEQAERERLPDPAKTIEGEVETYSQYLDGEVYGFSVDDEEGNFIDGSWGYYGIECVREEAFAVANGVRNHVQYKHDNHDSPVSAVISVRIDRSDFKHIAAGDFTDGDFMAVIEQLSRRMLDATISRESQMQALRDAHCDIVSPDA